MPEGDTLAAKRFLESLLHKAHAPLVLALLHAPEDDEPLDQEDLEHLAEAQADLAVGKAAGWEDLIKERARGGLASRSRLRKI